MNTTVSIFAMIAVVAGLAACSKAPDVVQAERVYIEHELPAGCKIHDFGEYNDLRRLVVVTCDGRATVSSNYTWMQQRGKTRVMRQAASVVVAEPTP